MSYVVLARKYRPPDFAGLVGQEHVVKALSNALTHQRLHHAYLFTGTRGVGKTTISRILAKSLNCTGPDGHGGITARPCGACPACLEIDTGRFIDYVELDAASNRGVDEISQLLDQAVYKPVVGRFKVYMIDEVHMLTTHAFNAMLKTLEEPPEYLKFVLATTDPQKVPPTVLSRCLQFNLRPMAPRTVQEHLADVLEREAIAAEPAALRLLARAAHGSMRDALSLADQAIAFGGGTLGETGVREMLGAVDRGHAVRLVEALAAGDAAAMIASVDALRSLGLSAAGTLEEMAGLLQQMAVLRAVPAAADASDPETPEALRLAGLLAADETQLLYSIVLHGRAELGLAPDEYSGLVMVLLRMLAFKPDAASPPPAMPDEAAPAGARAPAQAVVSAATPAEVASVPAASVGLANAPRPSQARAAPLVVAASAPTLRVRAVPVEPPPWLDVPDADEPDASPPAGPERHEAVEAVESTPARVSEAPVAPRPAVPPLRLTAPGERWAQRVRQMIEAGAISALVRELAMQAECLAIDDAGGRVAIRLRVEREMLRAPTTVEKLQAALAVSLGRDVALETEAGAVEDSPARREAHERERRQRDAEQILHDDPLVQALMAQYKTARIVPGSVKPH